MSPYIPYDGIDHAGGAYLGEHVRYLARDHEVTLFAPDLTENVRAAKHPQSAAVELVAVRPPPRSRVVSRWWNLRNFARGLTPGWQVLRGFRASERLRSALAGADVIELHWNYLLPMIPWLRRHAPEVPISVISHDVIAQSLERQSRTSTDALLRTKARMLQSRVRRQERDLLNLASVSYVFSEKDRFLLQQIGVRTPIRVNDPNLVQPVGPTGPADGRLVLFMGAMHRPENVGGVLWFLREVWPSVRSSVPGAILVIAGANPPQSVISEAGADVHVLGYVRDLDACYRTATVFVAPLLAGAGLKFKVPQAMLYGLPVVATTVGAEGVGHGATRSPVAAVEDSPSAFAEAVVALLLDSEHARREGARGREWASKTYSFDRSYARLLNDYDVLAHSGTVPVSEQSSRPASNARLPRP